MNKKLTKSICKILSLSLMIVIGFNIGDNLLNASGAPVKSKLKIHIPSNFSDEKLHTSPNSQKFSKIHTPKLGITSIAISTSIGIRHTERTSINSTIYNEIFTVSELISNTKEVQDELIGKNMALVQEYKNVLSINIKKLLDSGSTRAQILEAYTEQLEFRFIQGADNVSTLNKQKDVFLSTMESVNSKIEALKTKISTDFKNNDAPSSLEDIDKYLALKQEFYYARTYVIYINHFLAQYNILNNYNQQLLDTLINNKDAIIKDSFVVIPDTGTKVLKNLDLIFTEAEFKK